MIARPRVLLSRGLLTALVLLLTGCGEGLNDLRQFAKEMTFVWRLLSLTRYFCRLLLLHFSQQEWVPFLQKVILATLH